MKEFNVHAGVKTKDEWLTPPGIIKALGEFDLDPCSPINRPWPTAKHHFTILDNGLLQEWFGRVWMNPPYGKVMAEWLNKLAMHGNGIALTFAKTETNAFHNYVFPHADSIFFIKQRIRFFNVKGQPAFGGISPSVLIAYGGDNSDAINESGLVGKHLPVNRVGITVIGLSPTWEVVVRTIFVRLNRPAELEELYIEAQKIAPEKVANNKHFKAKIRQTVQMHFNKVKRATYESGRHSQ